MKRKAMAIFLALALMLSVVPTAFAGGDIIISADDATAKPGETVMIPVRITNNPGFDDSYVYVRVAEADAGVSIVGTIADVEAYNAENGTTYEYENGLFADADFASKFEISYAYGSFWNVQYADGVLFYIVVDIAETAENGDYTIEVYKGPMDILYCYGTGNNYSSMVTVQAGTLTVTDGTGGDPAPVDSPYTVSLEPSKESVAMGESVNVNVVVTGADFNAYDITVTYDTGKFTCGNDTTGSINLTGYNGDFVSGDTVKTLTFTAKDGLNPPVTGSFGITKAKIAVAGEGEALDKDAYVAQTTGTSVQILPQYAVTFVGKNGASLGTVTVTDGGTVAAADIPAAPAMDHYTFNGWDDGTGTLYTAVQIAAQTVTAPVTYTAIYTAETYAVTFDAAEINASQTATYGVDYTGTVAGYDGNYTYTVTAAFANWSKDYAVEDDGSFTIPAADITGPMTLTVSKEIQGVTVEVYADYFGGYSLIVAYGGSDVGYAYDGNAMYRTAHYDADTEDETDKAFAYIIQGTTTKGAALAALTVADTTAQAATASYDVNGTGTVDIADAQAVADSYNVRGNLAVYMPVYLRADVDASHQVNSTDANIVLGNRD